MPYEELEHLAMTCDEGTVECQELQEQFERRHARRQEIAADKALDEAYSRACGSGFPVFDGWGNFRGCASNMRDLF
jgi:hypothetical protein